jgi:ATP-binding cassette subfamily B protein
MLDKIKWLFQYYRKHPAVMAILIFVTPIQVFIAVSNARLIGFTIDYFESGVLTDHWLARAIVDSGAAVGVSTIYAFGIAYILFGRAATGLYALFQSVRAWMNCHLEWEFRQAAFDGITGKGPDFFNRFRTGDLVTRMTDDVAEKLSWFACSGIFRFYEASLVVIFLTITMWSIDPVLTVWTAGPLPVLIFIFFRISSLLDRRYDYLQKCISHFNDLMEACFSGIRVVKAYVQEATQRKKFEDVAQERRRAEIDTVKVMTVVDSMYNYIWQFGVVVVLVAGGARVLYSDLSLGGMATFIYYVVWLIFPMFDIGQFLVKGRQSAVSINRLVELEDMPAMVSATGSRTLTDAARCGVTFDGVSFTFDGLTHSIVDDVTMDIRPGETVAVVGRVGSGKSWLVNMIPRLVDPTGGRIQLDGHDLREFRLADLRRSVGYVPQEPVLFSDSVRNNILFGRDHIPESELTWAVEVAQLTEEVARFPQGLDTQIGTRGMSISGGQKQRLALARALVGKPNILILDDCTSALDSRTEDALWERLHEVMPGLTAVIITHRPDTLERADRIIVLEDGRIEEVGHHDDLVERGGLYARIYRRYQLEEEVTS